MFFAIGQTFVFLLREEIFVGCDNQKFLMGIYLCGFIDFYAAGNNRKCAKFCLNKRLICNRDHTFLFWILLHTARAI